jgi:hypothetical protein
MKIATVFLAGAAMLGMAQAAQAAPKVSGKYAFISTALCQTLIKITKDAQQDVRGIDTPNGGIVSIDVGYIQFPDTAASSGDVSIESTGFEASAVRIEGSGFGVKPLNNSLQGQFTLTDTTFSLKVGNKTMLFTMSQGAGGKTINLLQKENATCINSVVATKQ